MLQWWLKMLNYQIDVHLNFFSLPTLYPTTPQKENVKNLKTHDNGNTFKEIIRALKECGYPHIYFDVFNTSNFNLAQTRNRVFIFASRIELPLTFTFSHDPQCTAILPFQCSPDAFLSTSLTKWIGADGSKKVLNKFKWRDNLHEIDRIRTNFINAVESQKVRRALQLFVGRKPAFRRLNHSRNWSSIK